jgi:hypothetical protein
MVATTHFGVFSVSLLVLFFFSPPFSLSEASPFGSRAAVDPVVGC